MTTMRALIFTALLLAGCGSSITISTSDGGDGGTGGGDTATATATGGAGGDPETCPDPLLGYDSADVPTGPLIPLEPDLAGITASVLDPFAEATTCETVIVGFAIGPAPCELPSAIDVVTFDAELPPAPMGPALVAIATLDGQQLFPTATPGIVEARFSLQTSHAAGLYPFVGAKVRANFCPALMPTCGPARAMRFRASPPSKGWHLLADDLPDSPGTDGALYFGLADCAPAGT